jgi:hypoxanthine-DNA glycosylase
MTEKHPFGSFVPSGAKYLLLGSFTTKEAFDTQKKDSYKWFYSNGGRNQFWPILEEIYGIRLQTRKEMQELFTTLGMAIADIIYQCERKKSSNLDINLVNIVYAVESITQILETNTITKIFFTSRFVETKFRRIFRDIINRQPAVDLITLPSPSPRYAVMSKVEKVARYKQLLPKL